MFVDGGNDLFGNPISRNPNIIETEASPTAQGAVSEEEHVAVFGEILLYFSNKRDYGNIYFSGKAKPSTSEAVL